MRFSHTSSGVQSAKFDPFGPLPTALPAPPDLANALFYVQPLSGPRDPRSINAGGDVLLWTSWGAPSLSFLLASGGSTSVADYSYDTWVGRQLNDSGHFIGQNGRTSKVFSFDGTNLTDESLSNVVLEGINNHGDLLGSDVSQVGDDFDLDSGQFGNWFIRQGTTRKALAVDAGAYLYALNDVGEVVGSAGIREKNGDINNYYAVYFDSAQKRRRLDGPAIFDEAHEINLNHQIIGITLTEDDSLLAVMWDSPDAKMTILPYGNGYPYSWPYGINRWGQIVGENGDGATLWLNNKLVDLTGKLIDPQNVHPFSFRDINDNGQILAAAGAHSAILQPVWISLAVDANRDGTIDLPPHTLNTPYADATSATAPFRFWINNDNDEWVDSSQTGLYTEWEQDDRDVSVTNTFDWTSNTIKNTRDLEDFARLTIKATGLTQAISNQDIRVGFKWTDVTEGAPAIKVFRATEEDGGLKYLTDATIASQQASVPSYYAVSDVRYDGSDHTLIDTSGTFVLPSYVFNNGAGNPSDTAYLLFEGCKAGKGQLKIIFTNRDGAEIGESPGVWMDLREPKDFIERWSCGDDALGAVQPVVRVNSKSVSPAWGSPVTDDEKDYVLYVHGYNMQDFEKQRWLETTYKRLWHLGYKGRVGGFSWPCSQSAPPYDASEEKAWQSATQLMTLLSGLKTAGYRVHVLGHSQGNVVVGEALQQWKTAGHTGALVQTYVASQAAIEAHCYDPNADLIPGFAGSSSDNNTPNVFVNYPPIGAPYLSASVMGSAATRFRNFENPRDYALTGNSLDPSAPHPGWQINQRLKPDIGYGWSPSLGFFKGLGDSNSTIYTIPNDRFQIFSYCAEGRSLALGSTTAGGVFANGNTDLSLAPFSYGETHLFHSGQFRSSMAERHQYWSEFLRTIGVTPISP
jgi:hypothetical protein